MADSAKDKEKVKIKVKDKDRDRDKDREKTKERGKEADRYEFYKIRGGVEHHEQIESSGARSRTSSASSQMSQTSQPSQTPREQGDHVIRGNNYPEQIRLVKEDLMTYMMSDTSRINRTQIAQISKYVGCMEQILTNALMDREVAVRALEKEKKRKSCRASDVLLPSGGGSGGS